MTLGKELGDQETGTTKLGSSSDKAESNELAARLIAAMQQHDR
jgi:hypothetical protein